MTNLHAAATPRDTIVDLDDGLIMRWSTHADAENVGDLVAETFTWMSFSGLQDGVIPGPNLMFRAAAKRLLSGKNAVMTDRDYALVEDTKREVGKNPIVACVSIHRVRAYYGCVDLFFGKPELIATDPDYRNKGLIRKLLFEMIHPESDARGDSLQFIPGIPHFYRQFGYEYALVSFTSGKIENIQSIPALAEGKTTEPFLLRKATPEDIPYLISMSTKERVSPYTQLGLYYSPEYWQYTVKDIFEIADPEHPGTRSTQIVVDAATGKDVGFTIVSYPFGLKLEALVLDENVIIQEALYPILRQIVAMEKTRLEEKKAKVTEEEANKINTSSFYMILQLHPQHPAAVLLGSKMVPTFTGPGFRLCTRINDYPKFIRTVTPELEKRLARSSMAGTTGRLRLDFYRKVEGNKAKGLEIIFEKGKILEAREWTNPGYEKTAEEYLAWKAENNIPVVYGATFAPLTFNNLLTGERSLEELIWSYGETAVKNEASKLLLNSLFPKISQHMDNFYW
ncbi:hypothetical protein BGZ80_004550 [Entomortierella chlamydospora]|uniref:Uncharacterized protein n=1 Tax=Entomortierella chlamydospora TaxID=101097 RepID=A0A9P6MLY9_9FUNG|nr:hypothetical protein BGZ79_009666 [Entomortierella chlamydospora]KAG0007539.1 hypothetical protein BGZ80_004550 [Entomortierella chlamydospora]